MKVLLYLMFTQLPFVLFAEESTTEVLEEPNAIKERELWHQQEALEFFRKNSNISDKFPLNKGFALMWLGEDLESANEYIHKAYILMLEEASKEAGVEYTGEINPKIAGAERIKWQFRTWVRTYNLFSDKSNDFPGRLSAENQKLIEQLFWNWLSNDKNLQ